MMPATTNMNGDTPKTHGVPEDCIKILHPVCHHPSTIAYFSRTKLRYAR